MIIYHGSNMIVTQPMLIVQNRALDFGRSFYTSTNERQAVSFANSVYRRRRDGKPIVSVYEFDEVAAFIACKLLRFDNADEAWLNFVSANRNRTYHGESYDLIYGPVANDDVYVTFQLFEGGELSKDETLSRLRIKELYNHLVFSSEHALTYLRFVGTLEKEGSCE